MISRWSPSAAPGRPRPRLSPANWRSAKSSSLSTGAFSAWSRLQTDVRYDFKETFYGFWDQIETSDLEERFSRLEADGRAYLIEEGVKDVAIAFERSADFRYHGQEYVLTTPIPSGAIDMQAARCAFDRAYEQQYGHSSPDGRVEIANTRVAAIGKLPRPENADPMPSDAQPASSRPVYFAGQEQETAIVDRAGLASGSVTQGPAIIEESTATTLVPPGWQVEVITGGHLSVTRTENVQ